VRQCLILKKVSLYREPGIQKISLGSPWSVIGLSISH
jgi:hypothetical protein